MRHSDRGVEVGVVAVVRRGGRFLVIRRAAGVLAGGAWCFVGGAVEPGETQEVALVREFAEELGARVEPLRKLWEYVRPDGRLVLHWWLARLPGRRLRPNSLEVAEVKWVTLDELAALRPLLPSNRAFLAQLRAGLLGADGL